MTTAVHFVLALLLSRAFAFARPAGEFKCTTHSSCQLLPSQSPVCILQALRVWNKSLSVHDTVQQERAARHMRELCPEGLPCPARLARLAVMGDNHASVRLARWYKQVTEIYFAQLAMATRNTALQGVAGKTTAIPDCGPTSWSNCLG